MDKSVSFILFHSLVDRFSVLPTIRNFFPFDPFFSFLTLISIHRIAGWKKSEARREFHAWPGARRVCVESQRAAREREILCIHRTSQCIWPWTTIQENATFTLCIEVGALELMSWSVYTVEEQFPPLKPSIERDIEKSRWRISLSLSYTFFFSFPYRLFIYRTWSPIESERSALSDPSTDRHWIVCMLAKEENGSWSNEMESQNPLRSSSSTISPRPIHCRHTAQRVGGGRAIRSLPLYV